MSYAKLIFAIILINILNLSSKEEWQLVRENLENETILEINCIDSNNCNLITEINNDLFFYKSSDYGKSWIQTNIKEGNKNVVKNNTYAKIISEKDIYVFNSNPLELKISENSGKDFRTVNFDKFRDDEVIHSILNFVTFDGNISTLTLGRSRIL